MLGFMFRWFLMGVGVMYLFLLVLNRFFMWLVMCM